MKKTLLLIVITFLVCINSFGQQQATIKDIVTITLPNDAEKLTKEKLASFKPDKGNPSPIVYENSKGETYRGKDILIQLNAASVVPSPGFLEQRKREMDDLYSFSQPQFYNTSIERFQNHSVVITHYENAGDEKGYFIFKSYNKIGDSILVGTLEYDKGNKEAAEKVIEEMLKSIKFKNP